MESKRAAGRHAADLVSTGTTIGLGTGTTVSFALERLAERIKTEGLEVRGVATSRATETKASELGIPLTTFAETCHLALTIDGADEVDPQKRLIKGGGGALVREKVVASISDELVVIVGRSKMVDVLGRDFLLPVEVVPFALRPVVQELEGIGCQAFVRTEASGAVLVTDNGNNIVDCRFAPIGEPEVLEREIDLIPGVVECGLFNGLAGRVVVGNEDGSVEVI